MDSDEVMDGVQTAAVPCIAAEAPAGGTAAAGNAATAGSTPWWGCSSAAAG